MKFPLTKSIYHSGRFEPTGQGGSMLKIILVSTAMLIWLQVPAFSDNVYEWTDENGVKHYSNSGPSEIIEDYKKEEELPADPASANPSQPDPAAPPPPAESSTDLNPDTPPEEKEDIDPEAEFLDATRLNLDNFPQEQGYLVQREKSIIASLQQDLQDPEMNREDVIERERKRLAFAIHTLEGAPLDKFGSQRNKIRQVGYYKYRIEILQSDPDAYFEYPQSDTD
jgi:hypothetical protein